MVRPARPWRTQFSPSPMRSVLVLLCLGTPGPPASPVVTHTAVTLAAAQTSPPPTTEVPTTPPVITRPPVRPDARLFLDS